MKQDAPQPAASISATAKYPGVEKMKTKIVSRSLDNSRSESLGFGFMCKDGVVVDEESRNESRAAYILREKRSFTRALHYQPSNRRRLRDVKNLENTNQRNRLSAWLRLPLRIFCAIQENHGSIPKQYRR